MKSFLNKKDYEALSKTWLIFYLYFSAHKSLEAFKEGSKLATVYTGTILVIYLLVQLVAFLIKRNKKDEQDKLF